MIGWAAATNTLSIEGWVLFGIVFMWQMPHFLAIAWMYRDEYARAGMPLLPVIEPDGRSTGRQAVLYTAALIPLSMMPTGVGLATAWYLVGAIVLGAILMVLSLEFSVKRNVATARRLFFGSILYLPILWALLVFDHRAHDRAGIVMSVTDLPALNATLNAISDRAAGHRLRLHPPRRAPETQGVHDRGTGHVGAVPDVVRDLPRAGRFGAVQGHRLDPDGVFRGADPARDPGGGDRAAGADHGVARAVGEVRQAPPNRALDAAGVAVRVGHRRDRLSDALSDMTGVRAVADAAIAHLGRCCASVGGAAGIRAVPDLTVSGTVVDAGTRAPIAGAVVSA